MPSTLATTTTTISPLSWRASGWPTAARLGEQTTPITAWLAGGRLCLWTCTHLAFRLFWRIPALSPTSLATAPCSYGGYGPFSVQRGARVIELRMGEDTARRCAGTHSTACCRALPGCTRGAHDAWLTACTKCGIALTPATHALLLLRSATWIRQQDGSRVVQQPVQVCGVQGVL